MEKDDTKMKTVHHELWVYCQNKRLTDQEIIIFFSSFFMKRLLDACLGNKSVFLEMMQKIGNAYFKN